MKPPPFDYEDPATVEEALDLLAQRGADGKVLAGGQSLVPLLNFRLTRPDVLIDVNGLQSLAYVRRDRGVLRIGALTRHATLERSPLVREHWPLLADAVRWVGHPQIRNRGTVGGSAVHADPAAELPVALTALDATFTVRSRRGERTLTCAEMFRSQLESGLEDDELLIEIAVPPMATQRGWAFEEYARRHGDFALGGAAVALAFDGAGTCRDAAIALLGAGPTPLRARAAERALAGERVGAPTAAWAAAEAVRDVAPTGDIHGGSGYRCDLSEALVRRALLAAAVRGAT